MLARSTILTIRSNLTRNLIKRILAFKYFRKKSLIRDALQGPTPIIRSVLKMVVICRTLKYQYLSCSLVVVSCYNNRFTKLFVRCYIQRCAIYMLKD